MRRKRNGEAIETPGYNGDENKLQTITELEPSNANVTPYGHFEEVSCFSALIYSYSL